MIDKLSIYTPDYGLKFKTIHERNEFHNWLDKSIIDIQ